MNRNPQHNDPLHAYETDPQGDDTLRMKRVLQIKAAIEAGEYDVNAQLRRFLTNIDLGPHNRGQNEQP